MEKHIVETKNGNLVAYAQIHENSTPILLIHGDSGRASQWDGVASIIGEYNSVVSFDTAGHGASSSTDKTDYSYQSRADDVRSVVAKFDLSNVIVVAHSGGAGTALEYASSDPSNVKGVFLLDPATDASNMPEDMRQGFLAAISGDDGLQATQGYYASIAGSDETVVGQVMQDAAAVAPEARVGVAKTLLYWNPQESLDKWHGPISALITAANDNPGALYKLAPNMKVEFSENVGHWLQLDQPEATAQAILRFGDSL